MSATYNAEQVAELLGVSTWAIYEAVRRGDPPITPIRVGRRLLWSRAAVDNLLGLSASGCGTQHATRPARLGADQ